MDDHTELYLSHMPLDIMPHWDWRNPLNILAALPLVVVLVGVVGLLF